MRKNLTDFYLIPWKDGGRDYSGCDCWGFVRLVSQDYFDQPLPVLPAEYHSCRDQAEVTKMIEQYRGIVRACERRPGALIHIAMMGWAGHFGIMIDDRHFLHMEHGRQVNRQDINGKFWKGRILGFYEPVLKI